jgi:hypothetical protein
MEKSDTYYGINGSTGGGNLGRLGSRNHGVCRGCGQDRTLDVAGGFCTPCHDKGRATNSERIKEIEEAIAADPLRTETDEDSDYAAQERMRAYKPDTWELGKGPGSYG